VIQWAAIKWGFNPLLGYADTTMEASWDQTGIGDQGGSSGLFQVADRGATHAYPGFSGYGANLARENTCFNADFWFGRMYSAYVGLIGSNPAYNFDAALQSWYSGTATSGGSYSQDTYYAMESQLWVNWYYNGQPVPY